MGSNSKRNFSERNVEGNSLRQFTSPSEPPVSWRLVRRSVWLPILKAAVLGSTVWAVLGSLPAYAEALRDWGYDVQTRSLNLTLPPAVTPRVSVTAPDQMLLELPNMQVGDVMSQTVEDGMVESVVLQQATPETVWVTVEFAEGTVLSEAQYARPLAADENGDQQWQVRPALASVSRRQTPDQPSAQILAAATATATESSANSLRTESDAIAQSPDQTPDFSSDLPVLEPAMPIDQPVSVPPLNSPAPLPTPEPALSPPPVAVDTPPADYPVAETPTSEPLDQGAADISDLSPVFDVEVIPVEPTPTLRRPLPTVASEPASGPASGPASEPVSEPASASLPEAPPFLDELDDSAANAPNDQIEASPTVMEPEPIAEVEPDLPIPEAVTATTLEAPEQDAPIAAAVATQEPEGERIASGTAPAAVAPTPEPVIVEDVQPANVNRWPEPIPFGQPLPN